MPGGHSPEHVAVVSPVAAPYVPGGQGVHVEDVAPPAEYEPRGHRPVQLALTLPVDEP